MPDPAELLAAARLLIDETRHPATDAQCRRAISTAYYALYHHLSRTAAERFAGPNPRGAAFGLIYRAFDHTRMKDVCNRLAAARLGETLARQLRRTELSDDMRGFAFMYSGLQEARHLADYDPFAVFGVANARDYIENIEIAMAAFDRAGEGEQADVLALMLVKPRA